jgi:hypothetical protein
MRNQKIMAARMTIRAKILLHQMTKLLVEVAKGLPLELQAREALVDQRERFQAKMSRVMMRRMSMNLKRALVMRRIVNGKIGATFVRRLEACCAATDAHKLLI